jgi:hypothetical protein
LSFSFALNPVQLCLNYVQTSLACVLLLRSCAPQSAGRIVAIGDNLNACVHAFFRVIVAEIVMSATK